MLALRIGRLQTSCWWKHDIYLDRFIYKTHISLFWNKDNTLCVRSAVNIHNSCPAKSGCRKFEWTLLQDYDSITCHLYLSNRFFCTKHGKTSSYYQVSDKVEINANTVENISSSAEFSNGSSEFTASTDNSASENNLRVCSTDFSSSTSGGLPTANQSIDDEHYYNVVNEKLTDLQKLLECNDEQLNDLIIKHPYIGCHKVIENITEVVKVLMPYAFSKKQFYLVNCLFNCLVYCDASEVKTLLENNIPKSYKKKSSNISKVIKSHATKKVTKGEENRMKFISEKLDIELDTLLSFTDVETQKALSRFHPCYINCRIDYLLWEGMTKTEIALNLKLLKHSSLELNKKIIDMKANLGKISINVLLNGIPSQPKLKNRGKLNRIYKVLNCSRKDFSSVEKAFMDSNDESEVFDTLQYLLKLGFCKTEIKKNIYILGHRPEFIKHAFETNNDQIDMTVLENQRLLLNLMIYDLEYGYKHSTW